MKSKEAIRKEIIHYINLTWDTKSSVNRNPLVNLMIETICNELYLLENKLTDIDLTILEKLVNKLAPSGYNYIRPAHSILYVKPSSPIYHLDRKTVFTIKNLSNELKNKEISSVGFTPVSDTILRDISVTHIFQGQTLWSVDSSGNKRVVNRVNEKSTYNTVWIKLDTGEGVKYLKDLFFYLDFPHLNDNHDYFDLLPYVKWFAGGKPLEIKHGFPITESVTHSKTETDILAFYNSHYQTILSELNLNTMEKEHLPNELIAIMGEELASNIEKGYWLSIIFPPQFNDSDLSKLVIAVNAFPALNRQYNETRVSNPSFGDIIPLSSDIGEDFLEMDTVSDSSQRLYKTEEQDEDINGTFNVEPIRKKNIADPKLADYLERLIDIAQDEKTAFPEIDSEKISSVLDSIKGIQNEESSKVELNRLNEYAEVGRILVYPFDNTGSMDISYWTSHVEHVNGIPAGTSVMAIKVAELNKSNAILLTQVSGGKSSYDIESLKAINRYYLTSKDRILTKHNILSFCRVELGKYIKEVDVVRKARITPQFKQGIINVMEIQLTPKDKYIDYLKEKGVVKDLKTRLKLRSPDHYNYTFKVIESANK